MKIVRFLAGNIWTYIGSGFVIITVTGSVQRTAIYLTILGVVVECAAALTNKDTPE